VLIVAPAAHITVVKSAFGRARTFSSGCERPGWAHRWACECALYSLALGASRRAVLLLGLLSAGPNMMLGSNVRPKGARLVESTVVAPEIGGTIRARKGKTEP
jgi:hypothetical protein